MAFLTRARKVEVTNNSRCTSLLQNHFGKSEDVWISKELAGRLNKVALPEKELVAVLHVRNLTKPTSDFDIIETLSKSGSVFENLDVLQPILAVMVTNQLEGKSGPLQTSGRPNIFYVYVDTKICCLFVNWVYVRSLYSEWRLSLVDITDTGKYQLGIDYRVFTKL